MSTANAEDDVLYDVCVVGAGIGGLAVSLALAQQGVQRVLLVERDAHFFDRKQGYGLTLTNSLHGPLARLGLLEQCIEKNCPSQSHFTFNAQGEILGYYGRVLSSSEAVAETLSSSSPVQHHRSRTQGGNRGNLRVPRQELRQMMLDALHTAQREHTTQTTMLWAHRLVDYEESEREVVMTFSMRETISVEDGTEEVRERIVRHRACVLLGADGLRSRVRELRDEKQRLKDLEKMKQNASHVPIPQSPLRYLGVSVIIGIAPISHPLLTRKGFYVLDGENRLFTMPYFTPGSNDDYRIAHKCTVQSAPSSAQITNDSDSGAHNSGDARREVDSSSTSIPLAPSPADTSLIPASVLSACSPVTRSSPFVMWQLSFSGMSEEDALSLKSHTPFPALLETALRRVEHMFPAVHTLIANTLHSREAWATPLYDRENMAVVSSQRERERRGVSQRVTVLGDAAHPMSMFKGQGANMALEDAVLFASYLAHGKSPSQLDKEKDRERRKDEEGDREGNKKRMRVEEGDAKESDPSASEEVPPAHAHPHEHERPVVSVSLSALPRSVICTRICNFEREMVARAGVKAQSSRAAALRLHSPQALQDKIGLGGLDEVMKMVESERMCGGENENAFCGDKEAENAQGKESKSPTEEEVLAMVLQRLREKGVNASLGEALDQKFRETIIETVREV